MRHFQLLALAIAPLSFGVFAGSMEGALVASTGTAHGLQARQLRALPRAVDVSAIAVRADAHLHPAAAAVVEPVGRRLLEQPQDPSPTALDSAGAARHNRLCKAASQGAEHRGPGVRRQSNCPGLRLFAISTRSIAEAASAPGTHRHPVTSSREPRAPDRPDGRSVGTAASRPYPREPK